MNPHNEMFGLTEQWTDEALNNPDTQVCMFSVLNPSVLDGFAGEPCILSACLKDTLLWHLWTVRNGVQWKEHTGIAKRVRSTEHTNGDLLSIFYATERDYSKKLRNRVANLAMGPETVQEIVASEAIRLFGEQDFAFMANNDAADVTDGLGTRLPNTPHGLNKFQEIHNCVVFSALNLTPAHIAFLNWCGVSTAEIRCAISYQATYQAALRISLRNPEDMNPKRLVVQDKGTADYIAKLFDGSTVRLLSAGLAGFRAYAGEKGRGRDIQSAERKRAYREEKRLSREVGVHLVDRSQCVPHTNRTPLSAWDKMGPISDQHPETTKPAGMSVFLNKETSKPFAEIQWEGIDPFVDLLRLLAVEVHAGKEDNRLISPSLFDTKLAVLAQEMNQHGKPKSRGRVNVVSSIGIWLDNDLGVMTHQQFAALFPDLQMVIYSTYSSQAGAPKYRVWIPTSHAMSAEVYMFITAQIRAKIEAHGDGYRSAQWLIKWIMTYDKRNGQYPADDQVPYANHGFDWSKTAPENLMYLPCKAADPDPAASFFLDLRGGLRKPLDVMAWITHPIIDTRPEPDPEPAAVAVAATPVAIPTGTDAKSRLLAHLLTKRQDNAQEIQNRRVAKALADWHATPKGFLYTGFFTLGSQLLSAGLDLSEVKAHLLAESRPGSDRRERVAGIIHSLRKRS
jgi:hypothetical protein